MRNLLALLALIITAFAVQAQFNSGYKLKNNIPVIHGQDTLRLAWAGGLNNPQFSGIDLNLDGKQDIFIFDRDGQIRRTFIYDQTSNYYRWDSLGHKPFPIPEGGFMLLRDYDNDGKQDAILQPKNSAGLDVFKNVSDSSLKFTLVGDDLKYKRDQGGALYFLVQYNDLPAIQDMDDDGDLDFIIQSSVGLSNNNMLIYIQGMSMEKYGVADSLDFKLRNKCWGAVSEYVSVSGWTQIDCSDTTDAETGQGNGARHGSTTITSLDLDGDTETDLLIGDSYIGTMMSMIGNGSNLNAEVTLANSDTTFPSYDTPIDVPSLAAAYIFDVNHDGKRDLIASPNQPTYLQNTLDTSINTNVDWYYENKGTDAAPNFELTKKGFLNSEMIDVGSRSYPALVDLNGDGLDDLVVGSEGFKIYGGTAAAKLHYYQNIGSVDNPIYKSVSSDFASVSNYGFGFAHPTFTDLDNDGDQDMMVGDDQGMLHYFKNIGNSTSPQLVLFEAEFNNIDVDLAAHPQFFDLSTDGIPDLVIGDYYGRIQYFENTGTAEEYDFSSTPSIKELGDIMLFNSMGGEATPYLTQKSDSTGRVYMFVGTAKGTVLAYGPINNVFASLSPIDSLELEATYTSLTGANLSGDLRDELIIGQRTGGLFMMKRDQDVELGVSDNQVLPTNALKVYPNPAKSELNVFLPTSENGQTANVSVIDLTGKTLILEQMIATNGFVEGKVNLTDIPSGLYLINVSFKEQSFWQKIVIE